MTALILMTHNGFELFPSLFSTNLSTFPRWPVPLNGIHAGISMINVQIPWWRSVFLIPLFLLPSWPSLSELCLPSQPLHTLGTENVRI